MPWGPVILLRVLPPVNSPDLDIQMILFPISCFERNYFKMWFTKLMAHIFFTAKFVSGLYACICGYESRFGAHYRPELAKLPQLSQGKNKKPSA